jgi:hypothetical protein
LCVFARKLGLLGELCSRLLGLLGKVTLSNLEGSNISIGIMFV